MNSAVLGPQLKALGLIPETVESKVLQSKNKKDANAHLLNHLKADADEESVTEVFRIASKEEGYGRMKAFAAGMFVLLCRHSNAVSMYPFMYLGNIYFLYKKM